MRLLRVAWLLLFVPITSAQVEVDRQLGEFRAQREVLYLWSGNQVRRLAPGFEGVMADLYWLRTIQYFGGQKAFAKHKNFDLLKPLVDIATSLDPRMEIAYRYGAIFLSEGGPIGAGRPEEGIALLEKGAPLVAEGWRLRQQAGYFTFLFLHDAKGASETLVAASKMPGAPYWLESLAGQVLQGGGERGLARQLWRRIFDQSEPGSMKSNALAHLEELDTLDALDALGQAVEDYRARRGDWPPSAAALRADGFSGPIVDATGVPFDYDPSSGTFRVSGDSRAWRPSMPPPATVPGVR